MNKKSHISLAIFLANDSSLKEQIKYKKEFYFGSILPDLRPSFLYQQHTFQDTFVILRRKIESITDQYDSQKGINGYYCKQLGVIAHYIADYFTYPHNKVFKGGVKEHWNYEKEMISALNNYMQTIEGLVLFDRKLGCKNAEDICNYIKSMHELYRNSFHSMKMDCGYIVEMCYKVVETILQVSFAQCEIKQEELISVA